MKRKPINWNAISAIGQVISGVAVAMTLIYLTAQVRYAKIAASDANRLARSNGVVNFFLTAAHNPEFRRMGLNIGTHRKFIEEVARRLEITIDEATQINCSAHYWFWLHWGQWSTTTEARDRAELKNMVQKFYTKPHIRIIWEANRSGLDASFTKFVDDAIAEVDADPSLQRKPVDILKLAERLDELGLGLPYNAEAAGSVEAQGK